MSATPWRLSEGRRQLVDLSSARARRVGATLLAAPTWTLLAGLVAASALVRGGLALTSPAPWIIPDELIYGELARSFAASGHFVVRDVPFSAWTYGPLYPVIIAPAYLVGANAEHAYLIAKAINCILMSLAALPAYFLARRLVSRNSSLLVSLLAVLVPSAIYTTKMMTESVAYPVFILAMLATARMLERPTAVRQVTAFAAIGLAVLTRAEMIVLVPALLTSIVVLAATEGGIRQRNRRIRAFLAEVSSYGPTWALVFIAPAIALLLEVMRGHSAAALLGAHQVLLDRVRPLQIPTWLIYHAADIDLYAGIVPFAAFLIFIVISLRDHRAPRAIRAFAALSAAAFAWLLLLGAVYGTQRRASPPVFDRYIFYVFPLFLVALVCWVDQGLPRPRRVTLGVAAITAVLPLALPFSTLLTGRGWGTNSSTVGLILWAVVGVFVGHGVLLKAIVLLFSIGLASALVRLARERGSVLVRITVWNALAISVLAGVLNSDIAGRAAAYASRSPGWVDAAVGPGARVAAIWSGDQGAGEQASYALWETEFFNRSIGPVYVLRRPLEDLMPFRRIQIRDGRLFDAGKPVGAEYVVATTDLRVRAQPVVRDKRSRLVLYRVAGEIRLSR